MRFSREGPLLETSGRPSHFSRSRQGPHSIKLMRASFLVLFLTIKASAQLTWSLAGGNENWPADKRTAIIAAMTEAVAIYNANGYFPKTLWANYNASVPTAQASYSGWIDFGGQISTRTAMHEISHTLGVGQYSTWSTRQSNGVWTGTFANNRVKLFDGPAATIGCDSMHFWPYGLNFPNEDNTSNRIRHVKVVSALRRDMGIVTDSDGDGIPNDWEMFYFGNLTQTASGDADGDGVNNLNKYNADNNPAAAATQWNGSTSSDWSVATNWTPVIAPSNGTFYTRINVNNNGNHALVYSSSQGSTVFRPADRGLAIGSGANNANTTGTMNITGGTFSTVGAQSPDIIGNGQGNSGTLNIAGGSYASDDLQLGVTGQGTGTFNLNSGSASISALSFRFASGGTGTVNLIEYALCIPPDSAQPHPLDQSTGAPLTRFNRDPNRTDIIITVEASDHLTQWTPIARSTSGAPFASLVSNVTCSETPLNPSLMRVSISDTSSSANRRFLRISVTR